MNWRNIPFFQFGSECDSGTEGPPLGIISGLLLFDSGEAENTFIFRCQDRYLTYNALCGVNTVLFVTERQHKNHYLELLEEHARTVDFIGEFTGIDLPPVSSPLFVPLDPERLEIDRAAIPGYLPDHGISADGKRPFIFNQVSPSSASLTRQLEAALRWQGCAPAVDTDCAARVGELALRFHDKSEYVSLVQAAGDCSLPPHARTAVLELSEFLDLRCPEQLAERLGTKNGNGHKPAYYVKSSFDSGGNVARRLAGAEFEQSLFALKSDLLRSVGENGEDVRARESDLRELKDEIALTPSLSGVEWSDEVLCAFRSAQLARRKNVKVLLQEAVEKRTGNRNFHGIGFTCLVDDEGQCGPPLAAGQLYRDPERSHFLGSYLDSGEMEPLEEQVDASLRSLCRLFAARGYRGPLNFDAVEDESGRFVFVFDCNPRLTAVYPALAVRSFLCSSRLPVTTIVSTGYRGEFIYHDLKKTLRYLEAADLLFCRKRQRGVLLLPNIYRDHGFDAFFINMPRHEWAGIFASGALHHTAEPRCAGASRMY